MTVVTFLLLLVIAAAAAGVIVLLLGGGWRAWAAYMLAFSIALVFPTLLPKLLGG
jgi:hypothetical protein